MIMKARDHSRDEWVSSDSCENSSFIPYLAIRKSILGKILMDTGDTNMFDLLQLDDYHIQRGQSQHRHAFMELYTLSTFLRIFSAKTLSSSPGCGLASFASHTLAKVP